MFGSGSVPLGAYTVPVTVMAAPLHVVPNVGPPPKEPPSPPPSVGPPSWVGAPLSSPPPPPPPNPFVLPAPQPKRPTRLANAIERNAHLCMTVLARGLLRGRRLDGRAGRHTSPCELGVVDRADEATRTVVVVDFDDVAAAREAVDLVLIGGNAEHAAEARGRTGVF